MSFGRTFTARLAFNFALVTTATTAVVLILVGWVLSSQGQHSLEVLHEGEFRELSQMIRAEPGIKGSEIGKRIGQDTDNDAGLYFTQIHDSAGRIIFRSANLGALVLPHVEGSNVHETVTLPGLGRVRLSAYSADGLHYEIASTLSPLLHVLDDYERVAAIILGCVALASLAIGRAFARVTLRPIRAIRETALRIRADNLSERIPLPEGRDELSALALLLNQMFDRLEAAFHQSRRFTADASHELKTPLALIRLNAERLRPSLSSDPAGAAHLEDMLEDIEHLHRIMESLLFLAKAESGAWSAPMSRVTTASIVDSLAGDAEALAEEKGVRFSVLRNDPAMVECEPTLIHQLLLNLTTNAVRACKPGGSIGLAGRVDGSAWHLELTDEGPGVPADQIDRIFQRFVRFDRSDKDSPQPGRRGHGLGLAIAQSIATLHGGTLSAANRTDRPGLRVEIELPIVRQGPPA